MHTRDRAPPGPTDLDETDISQRRSAALLELIFDRMPVGVVILDSAFRIRRFNTTWLGFVERYSQLPPDLIQIGMPYAEVVPGNEAALAPIFARVLAGEQVEVDSLPLTIGGRTSYWNSVIVPELRDGAVAAIVCMATDVTRRKQAEELALTAGISAQRRAYQLLEERVEERTRELEQRRRVAASMRDMLAVLNSDRPMDAILSALVAQASRLLGADIVAIHRLGDDGRLTVQSSIGLSAEEIGVMGLRVGQSASGQAVLARRPVVLRTDAPEFAELLRARKAEVTPEQRGILDDLAARIKTLLAVPLAIKDDVYGTLALYFCDVRSLSEEEVAQALAFADQAALGIENARLRERSERAAALEERARLARDLHDSVTQSLYSLTLFAEVARRAATQGDIARVTPAIDRLSATARQALKDMRLLVHQLRPSGLAHDGLVAALQQRLDVVEGRAGVQARLLVEGDPQLPADAEEELYYIAQEALNNALKHAGASRVAVRLSSGRRGDAAQPPSLRLEITDDGCGFDPGWIGEHCGLGIIGMRERAARLGGTLVVRSAPGQGTSVALTLDGIGDERHDTGDDRGRPRDRP